MQPPSNLNMENRYFLIFKGGGRDGEKVPLRFPKTTVGRKPENALVLDSNKVSGNHAELEITNERVLVRDLGSMNGTYINGFQLEDEALLDPDDVLKFGETELRFMDNAKTNAAANTVASTSSKAKRSLLMPALVVLLLGSVALYFGSAFLFATGDKNTSSELAGSDSGQVKKTANQVTEKYTELSIGDYLWRINSQDGSLRKIDSELLSGIRLEGIEGKVEFESERKTNGVTLRYRANSKANFRFEVSPAYFAERGILLLHSKGHARFSADFLENSASSLVFGEERNQLQIRLPGERLVRGRTTASGFLVEIPASESFEVFFQIGFEEEKRRANDLLIQAERFEESQALGQALAAYSGILNEFPFEKRIVEKAGTRRDFLLREGLERIAELEKLQERARFFGLVDSFREASQVASALSQKYQGCEIGERAKSLLQEINKGLSALEQSQSKEEITRLGSIAKGLEASGQKNLAQELRRYIGLRSGTSQGGDPQK